MSKLAISLGALPVRVCAACSVTSSRPSRSKWFLGLTSFHDLLLTLFIWSSARISGVEHWRELWPAVFYTCGQLR